MDLDDLRRALNTALVTGDGAGLRAAVLAASRLPGPRMDLGLLDRFARAAVELVQADRLTGELERLLDAWAATPGTDADDPVVALPCAAVLSYGAIGAARPAWWPDEVVKIAHAAVDPRWRVREIVAAAAQRLLDADWDRATTALEDWAQSSHPLRVRAAVTAVAEPRLLVDEHRAADAMRLQRTGVTFLAAVPAAARRMPDVRTLRQALGFTISVAAAASGDFGLLLDLAGSADPDLRWVATENVKRSRLSRWPDRLAELRAALDR